jgi:Anti-sigma-K factor rskA
VGNHDELGDLFRAIEAGDLRDEDGQIVGPLTEAERARLANAADAVGFAIDASAPPPALRESVLAAVRREAAASRPAPAAEVVELASRRRRWVIPAAVAAVAVAGAAFAIGFALRSDNAAPAPVEVAGAKLSAASASIAPRAEGMVEILQTRDGVRAALEAEELRPTTAGQYYQAWFVSPRDTRTAQVRVSVGEFRTATGKILIEFPISVDREKYSTFAITLEPDDGDPRQNGPTIAAGPVVAEPDTGATP